MKLIDTHSHWGTQRGYVLRTEAELAQQKKTWNSEAKYSTEEEMANYFRASEAQVILDLGFTKFAPLDEIKPLHDYSFATQRLYPDAIIGNWFHIDPVFHGKDALKLLSRFSSEWGQPAWAQDYQAATGYCLIVVTLVISIWSPPETPCCVLLLLDQAGLGKQKRSLF